MNVYGTSENTYTTYLGMNQIVLSTTINCLQSFRGRGLGRNISSNAEQLQELGSPSSSKPVVSMSRTMDFTAFLCSSGAYLSRRT